MEILTSNSQSSPEEKGKRLTLLRNMAGLSMVALSEKYDIGYSTIKAWEGAKIGGLSNKGARIIVEAMRNEGVYCELQWLLHGIGIEPSYIDKKTEITAIKETLENPLEREIAFFKKINLNSIVFKIEDDGMEPLFNLGDYVGGRFLDEINLDLADKENCIIVTEEYGTLCRRIQKSGKDLLFNLFCINPNTTCENPVLENIKILHIAPVKRTWK